MGFYLFLVHVATTEVHFLNKALFKDRNFLLSTIMIFGSGIVLLPTLALTSPMLEELLNYPVDTTGYMTIPARSRARSRARPYELCSEPIRYLLIFVFGGSMLVVYANWLMLGYSPEMDWRPVVTAGMLQGAGLGTLMPALAKAAFNTPDLEILATGRSTFEHDTPLRQYHRGLNRSDFLVSQHSGHAFSAGQAPQTIFHHGSRYGFNGQACARKTNDIITDQAAVVAVIGQFKNLY